MIKLYAKLLLSVWFFGEWWGIKDNHSNKWEQSHVHWWDTGCEWLLLKRESHDDSGESHEIWRWKLRCNGQFLHRAVLTSTWYILGDMIPQMLNKNNHLVITEMAKSRVCISYPLDKVHKVKRRKAWKWTWRSYSKDITNGYTSFIR